MAHDLKIPAVGESITTATLAKWLKPDGALVKVGDELVSIETDKIAQTLEADVSGILRHRVAEGEDLPIGAVIGLIDENAVPDSVAPEGQAPAPVFSPSPAVAEARATSVAAKIADDKGVNLAQIRGTGTGGRITKQDVLAAAAVPSTIAPLSIAPVPPTAQPLATVDRMANSVSESGKRTTRRKMSPLRRKIADHLVNAQQDAAILTTFNECDMSAVLNLRKKIQDRFVQKHSVKLGLMSIFLKAVVEALKDVPAINAQIDGDEIVQNHFYDIGVAVGTERGLVVPVIRDADQKSLADIERDILYFAAKAKDGKLQLDDLQGGVFTVSNGGIYGSLLSTPIINPPQSGILGMHAIQERPVAVNGAVVIRPMMYLALSYDHRLVDGKEAVTFLLKIKECVEAPEVLAMGL